MRHRSVAIDLGNTLVEMRDTYCKGILGDPIPSAANAVRELRDTGCRVVVHTARGSDERDAIAAHLAAHGIEVDEIVCGKPLALAYIDDRAIRFRGDWGKTLRELDEALGYKPTYEELEAELARRTTGEEAEPEEVSSQWIDSERHCWKS